MVSGSEPSGVGAPDRPARSVRWSIVLLYGCTILLSAALVFCVQPMFARLLLPMLGGSANVWTTSMLFFTTALLVGYLYVHVTIAKLGVRRQAIVHVALLAVAAVTLPVGLPAWNPPTGGTPVPWLLAVLVVAVGLPYVLVSATSPLIQRWLAETDHPAANDPYFLYRASNVGSVAGLLAYPLLMEPGLGVRAQTILWSVGFVTLGVLLIGCAAVMWRRHRQVSHESPVTVGADADTATNAAPVTWRRRAIWTGLALAPASLTQGVTSFLTTDLAPVPLLWVLPLALYLLSWVVVFSRGRRTGALPRALIPLFPILALAYVLLVLFAPSRPIEVIAVLHLAGLFIVTTVCHGLLAADRPPAASLTEFYGWLAFGGALGTGFNGVFAPAFFDELLEYPLALLLACVLVMLVARTTWLRVGMLVPSGVLCADLSGLFDSLSDPTAIGWFALLLGGLVGLLYIRRRPIRIGLLAVGTAAVVMTVALPPTAVGDILHAERNFFGVKYVERSGDVHRLLHGTTLHGAQVRNDADVLTPMTYYHPTGPLGRLTSWLADRQDDPQWAMVGLGTGTAACLETGNTEWTFYEIDPDVVDLAFDPELFSFMTECGEPDVVLGDARRSLDAEPDGKFGLIALDAFSSDAIPTHLLTVEAVELYQRKLTDDGVLTFHISNRYLDLEPILGAIAAETDTRCWSLVDSRSDQADYKFGSHWVLLGDERPDASWLPCSRGRAWTDDYSNLLSAFDL